jgi:hypothetical protein
VSRVTRERLSGQACKDFEGFRGQRFQNTRLHASVLSPMTKAVGIFSPSVRNAVLLGTATLAIWKL